MGRILYSGIGFTVPLSGSTYKQNSTYIFNPSFVYIDKKSGWTDFGVKVLSLLVRRISYSGIGFPIPQPCSTYRHNSTYIYLLHPSYIYTKKVDGLNFEDSTPFSFGRQSYFYKTTPRWKRLTFVLSP